MRSDYRLAVLWDGETVGHITPARNGGLTFSYAQNWLDGTARPKFSTVMNNFVAKIYELGENVKLGDLRCKK